ncbi:MAG: efflux RND transporter periplasmic adaptor subunit [Treponema sp.]|jgi:multidrug efflux pump subunit AcrA (membrane-fusion protein)|nr:efflux RND transporter periplasmic adaptor subunit [Treponema sp.]
MKVTYTTRPVYAAALSLIIPALLLGACKKDKAGPGDIQDTPVFAVNTSTAVQGQIWDYIALSGDIIAGSTVDVYSDVAGRVTRVYVEVGRRVARGAAIAAVDPSKPGMIFIPGVAAAPIAGTVVALPAQVGATVSQTVPLARISGGSALEIKLYVAERFISKVALNQPCEISLDAWPGETFRGAVTEVSPVVDPASRTMEVKVNVNNQGNKLKEGMFAKVRIITEQKENIVKIPASALIRRFGETYIFVAGTDPADPAFQAAKKRIVKPGIMIDGALEIEEGLRAGEEFVIKGQTLLNDGSRINIIERTPPLSAER